VEKDEAPLLLIIDQFEEFLLLNKAEQRAAFTEFLQQLAVKPIDGLHLLLVYRSDYRPLIFKLALPPPTLGKNWVEIAPYDRGEATEFLQGGGRHFSEEALDALFRGLDHIEEARGIYRLITLNMVGLILERMGQTLEGDPGRLIQRYLLDCLGAGEGHEFARPLLEQMITDAGTKEPRTESALIDLTGLERWQVVSALTGLGAQGLVRKLAGAEPTWEVSHDFLARSIGRLLGRFKPSLFGRVQPFVAPVALSLWLASMVLFVPIWMQRSGEQRVEKSFSLKHDNGVYALKASDRRFDDEQLSRVIPDLTLLSGSLNVDLSSTQVANIDALRKLKSLTSLNLSSTQVSNIDALKELKSLTSLNLSHTKIANIDALKELKSLTNLNLSYTQVSNIDALKELKSLTSLDLTMSTKVATVDALKGLTALQFLSLLNTQVVNLEPLTGLTALRRLDLFGTQVHDIEPLKDMTALEWLGLSHTRIVDLEPLKSLRALHTLYVMNTRVTNIEPLSGLTALESLFMVGSKVANIEPLKGLTTLQTLDLSRTQVSNPGPLRGLSALRALSLAGSKVANIEPLKGLTTLQALDLLETQVADLGPLRGLSALRSLNLAASKVANLEPLQDLPELKVMGLETLAREEADRFTNYRAQHHLPQ
jgi:internalin A